MYIYTSMETYVHVQKVYNTSIKYGKRMFGFFL